MLSVHFVHKISTVRIQPSALLIETIIISPVHWSGFYLFLVPIKNWILLFRYVECGVTRLVDFWKFLTTNLLAKLAQIYWWLLWLSWKGSFYVKTGLAFIGATFGNVWATFLLQYLVTLVEWFKKAIMGEVLMKRCCGPPEHSQWPVWQDGGRL